MAQAQGMEYQSNVSNNIDKEEEVNDDLLRDVSEELAQWEGLASKLGLKNAKVHNIKADYATNASEMKYQMLLAWKQKNGIQATYGALIDGLRRAGLTDLADDIEAGKYTKRTPKKQQKPPVEKIVIPSARAVLERYNMTRKPRGKCLILTYDKFTKAKKRRGNTQDMAKLTEIFETTLKFDVENELNFDSKETRKLIKDMADTDHTNYDCFVCFICSHGDGEAFLAKDDGRITIQEILTPFKAGNCKSLAGKPKIFFINTCLGESYQQMTKYEKDGPNMPADAGVASNLSNYAPNEADFCVVLSTVPGYVALRDVKNGTLFVQSFYDCLKEKYNDHHLVDILTIVNSDVNQTFEKMAHERGSKENPVGQVSTLVQTLNKAIYFSSP